MGYVTPSELNRVLRYEPDTGKLFWLPREPETFATQRAAASWNAYYPGREALTNIIPGGYRTGTVLRRSFRAHRVIWAMVHGEWPSQEI